MMGKLVIGDLGKTSDKQIAFFKSRTKHTAFGGARGGGKSWAVRAKAKMLCMRYAGIKVLIVRRTYPELVQNHINQLRDDLHGVARYNKTEKVFTFPNGSVIKFGYCNADNDLNQYQGAEYDVIFLDEATQLKEEWVKKITACLRGVNDFPKRIYYTCNPGGVGHSYIKRLFIDRKFHSGENPEDYSFIQSLVTDNVALMESQPDYIRQLEALPPKLRAAWLEGRWDIFEGQFFEEFRTVPDKFLCEQAGITQEEALQQRRFTHVIPAFDLTVGDKRGWRIMRSYDFGYRKPYSLGYWAIDYDGVLYRIAEIYGCAKGRDGEDIPDEGVKQNPHEQFRIFAEFERANPWLRERITDSVADPSIWDTSRGESTAEVAAQYGFYFTEGDNSRIPGWMQVHYRLQFDESGYPRMYVFDTCKAFIRTIPQMMFSDTKPEDLDTKLEDHVADEVRYMCMSRPVKPIIREEPKERWSDPLNQFTRR